LEPRDGPPSGWRYFVPLGDVEPGDVAGEPGDVDGELPVVSPGRGDVPGDAAGVRSLGRSLPPPVGDSVHPASTAVPSASAKNPLSNFFIWHSLLWSAFPPCSRAAIEVPRSDHRWYTGDPRKTLHGKGRISR
jgi:hypothetical protein